MRHAGSLILVLSTLIFVALLVAQTVGVYLPAVIEGAIP